MDVGRAVSEAKAGKIEFRVDKFGNVHAPIGKVSFELASLVQNFDALMDAVKRNRPSAAKGTYVRSVTVSSTMGPGVAIDPTLYR
jgi:large subunit ribosomal protein L1